MRRLLFCILCFAFSNSLAQQVDWIGFEKLQESLRTQPKPVLIFIHTSWCRFCGMQLENTFTDKDVVNEIQSAFYAVSLDAEQKDDVSFLKKRYRYKPTGSGSGYHELAEFLGKKDGTLAFPTTVILSASLQPLGQFPGFLNTADLLRLLENARVTERMK